MPAEALPDALEIAHDGGVDHAVAVGPAMTGAIYRSVRGANWYRVLTRGEAPIHVRQSYAALVGVPPVPGVAAVAAAEQAYGGGFFFVSHTIPNGVGCLQAVGDMHAVLRARVAAQLCAWLAARRASGSDGVVFTAAEVVLESGERPVLLPPAPTFTMPSIDSLVSQPARTRCLAPEVLRGQPGRPAAIANYALGVTLLQLFYRPIETPAEEMLLQVATGTVFASHHRVSRLAPWLERLEATRRIDSLIASLLTADADARITPSLAAICAEIEALSPHLGALQAVLDLREKGKPREALALAQNVLLENEDCDVMVLAGTISADDLERHLEAIDYFERAISARPHHPQAYERQLSSIERFVGVPEFARLLTKLFIRTTGAFGRLEGRALRDFNALPVTAREARVETVARILLHLGSFASASRFIWPHLMDGDRYCWWKFSLVLTYVEAKVGEGRDDDARAILNDLKERFAFVRQRGSMSPDELQRHGSRALQLQRVLSERQR